jgi:hydroxyisourate hydrolase
VSIGSLSTHVLDLVRGGPAAGVGVELRRRVEGHWELLTSTSTDADGRTGALLPPGALTAGLYELTFAVGRYHGEDAGFLDDVPVRFRVKDPDAAHHVPLLVTPWAYSTYRGS